MRKVLRALPVIKTEIEETAQTISTEATQVEQKVETASGGMPVWAIILIVTVIVLVLIAVAVFFVFLRKKNGEKSSKKSSGVKPGNTKSKSSNAQSKSAEPPKKPLNIPGLQKNLDSTNNKVNIPVPDRNGAIYPEVVLINLAKPDYVYRTRIIDKVMIGRAEGSDIRINTDAAVSSRHCVISIKGTQFYLEDCNSSNGTYYNDREVTEQIPIMSGGIIEIGHDRYRLMIGK